MREQREDIRRISGNKDLDYDEKTDLLKEKIELLSKALSPQDVQLYYQVVIKGREDLSLSPNGRVGMEMIVLRMMAFRPSASNSANVISTATQPQSAPIQNVSQQKVQKTFQSYN